MPGDGTADVEVLEAPATRPGSAAHPAARSVEPPPAGAAPPMRSRPWKRIALFMLLPVVLAAGAYEYVTGGSVMATDDAYVNAEKVGVSTDVSGIVRTVEVHDNEHVMFGQVLYRLDDQPFQLALQRADAQLGIIRNDVEALRASYGDIQTQIREAQNNVDYFNTALRRSQELLNAHVASQAVFDAARRDVLNAQQKLASMNRQLAGVAANLSGNPDIPVERQPRYLQAMAERDEAARQLHHTVVRAPFAGVVTEVPAIAPGKYLPASTTAFFLVASDHVWVDADPKETELTYVRPGQKVTVMADIYPDATWQGTVQSISPAASQEFSLLPAQNTSGNWVKVVQRIPMRVDVDTSNRSLPPLRAGMSVEVDVDTGHVRGWPAFLAGLFGRHPQPAAR